MTVLVYGDSLSWGLVPGTRRREPERWPRRLERALADRGVRVVEDCLNGRRTVFEDPYKPGRNGRVGLAQRIEACSPLGLVILMLGSNDLQAMHPHDAWLSAQGMSVLVDTVRAAPLEPEMPRPSILVVAPPLPRDPEHGVIMRKFVGAPAKAAGLPEALSDVAREKGCAFFDAGAVVRTSEVDGVHLDRSQHAVLAEALHPVVARLLDARASTP